MLTPLKVPDTAGPAYGAMRGLQCIHATARLVQNPNTENAGVGDVLAHSCRYIQPRSSASKWVLCGMELLAKALPRPRRLIGAHRVPGHTVDVLQLDDSTPRPFGL